MKMRDGRGGPESAGSAVGGAAVDPDTSKRQTLPVTLEPLVATTIIVGDPKAIAVIGTGSLYPGSLGVKVGVGSSSTS